MLSLTDIRRIIESGKPSYGPCTICGLLQAFAITQVIVINIPKNAITALCYSKEERKTFPIALREKRKLFDGANITFVACSRWLEGMAKQSELLKGQTITNIPNAINTNLFKPRNKKQAREKCHLPQDKKLLLFGSVKITDKRKGIDYLVEACKILASQDPGLT